MGLVVVVRCSTPPGAKAIVVCVEGAAAAASPTRFLLLSSLSLLSFEGCVRASSMVGANKANTRARLAAQLKKARLGFAAAKRRRPALSSKTSRLKGGSLRILTLSTARYCNKLKLLQVKSEFRWRDC